MSFFKRGKKKNKAENNTTEAAKWLQKIEAAKKVKKAWRDKFRVDLAYEYRDGAQRPSYVNENEWITINTIYSTLKAELPKKYSGNPYYYVKLAKSYNPSPPQIAQMEMQAGIRQDMLNYLTSEDELNLKETSRICILDAYFQYGVTKTRYDVEMVENPDAGNPILADDNETIIADEPEQLPVSEQYQIDRIHPDDFLVDSEAGPLEDNVSWMAHRIVRPLAEAKKDKRYEAKARKTLVATEMTEDEVQKNREERKKGLANQDKDVEPDMAVLWELYDIKNEQWLTVSEGCDEFLMKPDSLPAGVDKHPFNILRFGLPRDDSFYPVTPVSQWLDPQKEKNELRSKILVHRKRFNRKYTAYAEGFADPNEAMAKLENGEDGTIILTSTPQQVIFPISDASLDQNHINELMMLDNDFRELSTGANQRGSGVGIDSATEAGIIENRVSLLEGDDLSIIKAFLVGVGRKLDKLVQANLEEDVAVKVTGPQGEYWELVKPASYEEIQGEYKYSINVGSMLPQVPEVERAQWMSFLGLIANAPHLAMSKSLINKMAEMHHIEDETMVDELVNIAQGIMSGKLQMPGRGGSQPGMADESTRGASSVGGQAAGINNIRGGAQ